MRSWLWGLSLLLVGILAVASPLPGHVEMILIAGAIFMILKTECLAEYLAAGKKARWRERVFWFAAWTGFDAARFFSEEKSAMRPGFGEWVFATSKTLFGLAMWLGVAPFVFRWNEMSGGWTAMIGIIFAVHFGGLHLVALVWRFFGRDVPPIMNAPILSQSLSEFWGRRWNIAFRDFTHHSVFRPAARKWGAATATWISFVFSGLVHELAISIPAGGGYGLPFAYFLLQGVGIWLERLAARRGLPVRGGTGGWLFAVLFTVPAAVLLFHPPFAQNVIVPLIPN